MSPRTVFELLPVFWFMTHKDSRFRNNSLYSLEHGSVLLRENPKHTVYPTSRHAATAEHSHTGF